MGSSALRAFLTGSRLGTDAWRLVGEARRRRGRLQRSSNGELELAWPEAGGEGVAE